NLVMKKSPMMNWLLLIRNCALEVKKCARH
ncbi:hypothetical protein A2U01_0079123, partial [Trifolium medium]|nr:hypothetical protein [Trifolium medium]